MADSGKGKDSAAKAATRVLETPRVSEARARGWPVVIARPEPFEIVWANARALALLGASSLEAATGVCRDGDSPGPREIVRHAGRLAPGGEAQFVRLRFAIGGRRELVNLQVWRTAGADGLFVAVAPGLRQAILQALSAPQRETAGETPAAGPSAKHPAANGYDGDGKGADAPSGGKSSSGKPSSGKPSSGKQRFLWRTDARLKLADIGLAFCAATGTDRADLVGQDFEALLKRYAADGPESLGDAIARRETWSGLEVFWPLAGSAGKRVAVKFGGLPVFDANRTFEGFSGYGLVDLDRPVPDLPPATREDPPETQSPSVPETPAGVRDGPAAVSGGETEPDAPEVEEHAAAPVSVANVVPLRAWQRDRGNGAAGESRSDQPAAGTSVPSDSGNAGADTSTASGAAGAGSDRPAAHEAVAPPESPAESKPHGRQEPQEETPQEETPKAQTPKTEKQEAGAPDKGGDREEPDVPSDEHLVSLSSNERDAFREIARALGARIGPMRSRAQLLADQPDDTVAEGSDAPAGDTGKDVGKDVGKNAGKNAGKNIGTYDRGAGDSPGAPPAGEEGAPSGVPAGLPAGFPPEVASVLSSDPVLPAEAVRTSAPADAQQQSKAALVDKLGTGILVGREGKAIYMNQHMLELLGYADAEVFNRAGGISHMFKGRDPEALTRDAGGGAIPVITRSGDILAVEGKLQAVEWQGEAATLMTFRRSETSELTARIRALELDVRKRDTETRELRDILDTATDGVAVLDEEGRVLSLNKAGQALFGCDENEVAGELLTVFLARESHAGALDYLEGLKSNGVRNVLNDGREVMGRASKGGDIPLFMTIGKIGTGPDAHFCAVLRDITQWKRAEEELQSARREAERASALKSDFLAKVSHEIRTPLNAILGFAEVIMEERFGPVGTERYKDYLKDIHGSGQHVLSLVNDLLDLSKIEAGKLELSFGSVDANRIVNECVSLMQPQAISERVIMRLSLAPRLPHVVADERSLRQIVINVLSNAIKFNEPGGQVIISTALTDAGYVVVRVRDTGIGMSDGEVETALEPFRQIATSRETRGTGLGLPLTKALVEANRASFVIKSRKGEGTLIEVAFPPTRVLAE